MIGGHGADSLHGGPSADRFVFRQVADSPTGPHHDTIGDFHHAQGDKINLAAIDADTGTGGSQPFDFIGTAQFHDVAGELRFGAGAHALFGDVNGDGHADLTIALTGVASLDAGDLIL